MPPVRRQTTSMILDIARGNIGARNLYREVELPTETSNWTAPKSGHCLSISRKATLASKAGVPTSVSWTALMSAGCVSSRRWRGRIRTTVLANTRTHTHTHTHTRTHTHMCSTGVASIQQSKTSASLELSTSAYVQFPLRYTNSWRISSHLRYMGPEPVMNGCPSVVTDRSILSHNEPFRSQDSWHHQYFVTFAVWSAPFRLRAFKEHTVRPDTFPGRMS